jgi:hypothetical protein
MSVVLGVATTSSDLRAEEPVRGLRRVASVKDTGQERTVQFDLLGVERCMFGDLDLILLDFRHAQEQLRLQLTVESLGGTENEVFYGTPLEKKTSKANLGTFEVQLPVSNEGKMYGVYLCSVAPEKLGKEPCSKQGFKTFQAMMAGYKLDTGEPANSSRALRPYSSPSVIEPKNYYAHVLVSTPTSLAVIDDSTSPENEALLVNFGVSEQRVSSALASLNGLAKTLGSLPFEASDNRLQIPLPYFGSKKCNRQSDATTAAP